MSGDPFSVAQGEFTRRAIIVIPAARQAEGNTLALELDPEGGSQTFTVGLSADGQSPQTHYWCSTVVTEQQWAEIVALAGFAPDGPAGRHTDGAGAWLFDGALWSPQQVLSDRALATLQREE